MADPSFSNVFFLDPALKQHFYLDGSERSAFTSSFGALICPLPPLCVRVRVRVRACVRAVL
jgi:hypothetical protein